ncbi:MAG: AAA family ATPase [Pseudomonadota bacterium]
MAKEGAIYEDDLDFDFDDDPDLDIETDDPDIFESDSVEPAGQVAVSDFGGGYETTSPQGGDVNLEAPTKEVVFDDSAFEITDPSEGIRPIPAISVLAFLEKPSSHDLMYGVSQDRRMARVSLEVADGGLEAAIAYLSENQSPNLLIVESGVDANQMIKQIDRLAEHCDEGVEVMVIGATNDIKLYRQLTARGVSEYIVPPIRPLHIIGSIAELFTDPDDPFLGRSIAVVGAKGGVGSSTIAHNLAWAISENAGFNTTLVDLDVSFGTTALDFNEDPQQTVIDALTDPDRADDAVVQRLLAKATDRLSLFAAPASISENYDISDEAYSAVIATVRRNVPFIVLDLPHTWSKWMMQTLTDAEEVVLVCQPDLASLRNGKNIIDQLLPARPNDEKPKIVLNMASMPKRPEIPVKDFAAAIGVEPSIVLPFEPQLFGMASNNGQMISESDPAAKSSLAIDHLASLITGKSVESRPKSFIQKLLGK